MEQKYNHLEAKHIFTLNHFHSADFHITTNKILKSLSFVTVKSLVRVTHKMKSGVGPVGCDLGSNHFGLSCLSGRRWRICSWSAVTAWLDILEDKE